MAGGDGGSLFDPQVLRDIGSNPEALGAIAQMVLPTIYRRDVTSMGPGSMSFTNRPVFKPGAALGSLGAYYGNVRDTRLRENVQADITSSLKAQQTPQGRVYQPQDPLDAEAGIVGTPDTATAAKLGLPPGIAGELPSRPTTMAEKAAQLGLPLPTMNDFLSRYTGDRRTLRALGQAGGPGGAQWFGTSGFPAWVEGMQKQAQGSQQKQAQQLLAQASAKWVADPFDKDAMEASYSLAAQLTGQTAPFINGQLQLAQQIRTNVGAIKALAETGTVPADVIAMLQKQAMAGVTPDPKHYLNASAAIQLTKAQQVDPSMWSNASMGILTPGQLESLQMNPVYAPYVQELLATNQAAMMRNKDYALNERHTKVEEDRFQENKRQFGLNYALDQDKFRAQQKQWEFERGLQQLGAASTQLKARQDALNGWQVQEAAMKGKVDANGKRVYSDQDINALREQWLRQRDEAAANYDILHQQHLAKTQPGAALELDRSLFADKLKMIETSSTLPLGKRLAAIQATEQALDYSYQLYLKGMPQSVGETFYQGVKQQLDALRAPIEQEARKSIQIPEPGQPVQKAPSVSPPGFEGGMSRVEQGINAAVGSIPWALQKAAERAARVHQQEQALPQRPGW